MVGDRRGNELLGDGEQLVARRRLIVAFETTERGGVGLGQSESTELDRPIDGMVAELPFARVPCNEIVENLLLLVEAEVVEHRDAEFALAPGLRLLALLAVPARRVLVEPCAGLLDERVHVGLDRSSVHGPQPYCQCSAAG